RFSCSPDSAEPNDDPLNASLAASATMGPIEIRNLTLCTTTRALMTNQGDEDWFLIHPPRAGVRINASIRYVQGDLFLELFAPGGQRRPGENPGSDRGYADNDPPSAAVSSPATTPPPYSLRVSSIYSSPFLGAGPATDTPYTLDLSYTDPP